METIQLIVSCVHFASCMQKYVRRTGGWKVVMTQIDANDARIIAHLGACMRRTSSADTALGYDPAKHEQVTLAMTAQPPATLPIPQSTPTGLGSLLIQTV